MNKKSTLFWTLAFVVAATFVYVTPAYAPLVTTTEEPAEEEYTGENYLGEEDVEEETFVDSDVVDLSDIEDAENKPTWSPSFENQEK